MCDSHLRFLDDLFRCAVELPLDFGQVLRNRRLEDALEAVTQMEQAREQRPGAVGLRGNHPRLRSTNLIEQLQDEVDELADSGIALLLSADDFLVARIERLPAFCEEQDRLPTYLLPLKVLLRLLTSLFFRLLAVANLMHVTHGALGCHHVQHFLVDHSLEDVEHQCLHAALCLFRDLPTQLVHLQGDFLDELEVALADGKGKILRALQLRLGLVRNLPVEDF